jgi:hypothetical protein
VSLDIPESWFNSEIALKFMNADAQITVNARIAVRNLEGDIIQVGGMDLAYVFSIKLTGNGEESECTDVTATFMGGTDPHYMAFAASSAGAYTFAEETFSAMMVEGS